MKFKLLKEEEALGYFGDRPLSAAEKFKAQQTIKGLPGREAFTPKAMEGANVEGWTVGKMADPSGATGGFDWEGFTDLERQEVADNIESHAARGHTDPRGAMKRINFPVQAEFVTSTGKRVPYVKHPKKAVELPEGMFDYQMAGTKPKKAGADYDKDKVLNFAERHLPALLAQKFYDPTVPGNWKKLSEPTHVSFKTPEGHRFRVLVSPHDHPGTERLPSTTLPRGASKLEPVDGGRGEYARPLQPMRPMKPPEPIKYRTRRSKKDKAPEAPPHLATSWLKDSETKGYIHPSWSYTGQGPEVTYEETSEIQFEPSKEFLGAEPSIADFLKKRGVPQADVQLGAAKLLSKLGLKPFMTIDKGYWGAVHGALKEKYKGYEVPAEYREQTGALRRSALENLSTEANQNRENARREWSLAGGASSGLPYPTKSVKTFTAEQISDEMLNVAEEQFLQNRYNKVLSHLKSTGAKDLTQVDRQTGFMSDTNGALVGPGGNPVFNIPIADVMARGHKIAVANNIKVSKPALLWSTFLGTDYYKNLKETQSPEKIKDYFARFDHGRSGDDRRPEMGLYTIINRLKDLDTRYPVLPDTARKSPQGLEDFDPVREPEPRRAEEVGVIPSKFYDERVAALKNLPGGVQVTTGPGATEYTEKKGPLASLVGKGQLARQLASTLARGYLTGGRSALARSGGRKDSLSYRKSKANIMLSMYPQDSRIKFNKATGTHELFSYAGREPTDSEKLEFQRVYKQIDPEEFFGWLDKAPEQPGPVLPVVSPSKPRAKYRYESPRREVERDEEGKITRRKIIYPRFHSDGLNKEEQKVFQGEQKKYEKKLARLPQWSAEPRAELPARGPSGPPGLPPEGPVPFDFKDDEYRHYGRRTGPGREYRITKGGKARDRSEMSSAQRQRLDRADAQKMAAMAWMEAQGNVKKFKRLMAMDPREFKRYQWRGMKKELKKESINKEQKFITFNKEINRKNTILKEFKTLIKRED